MGPELMMRFREQAERFGARIENVDVTSVDFTKRPLIVSRPTTRATRPKP